VSDRTGSSCQLWDKLLEGFWFLICVQQQFSTLRYVTWVEYKQDLTRSVLHYSQMPDVQRLFPLCLYYRATGLYNIIGASWPIIEELSDNWSFCCQMWIYFWKSVSYPSGHNLALRTSNWKCNNTKLHGPTKLKSEPKKTWPPNFLLSLQTSVRDIDLLPGEVSQSLAQSSLGYLWSYAHCLDYTGEVHRQPARRRLWLTVLSSGHNFDIWYVAQKNPHPNLADCISVATQQIPQHIHDSLEYFSLL